MSTKENKDYVKLNVKVTVKATSKDKYHKTGEEYQVHPRHLDYLKANGLIEGGTKEKEAK